MSGEQNDARPVVKMSLGDLMAVFQAKILELGAFNETYLDLLTTHDFTKGNPTREQIENAVKNKIESIVQKSEQAAAAAASGLILPKGNGNLIIPK